MHLGLGKAVYYNPEDLEVKLEMNSGVFRIEGKHSNDQNVAVAGTL